MPDGFEVDELSVAIKSDATKANTALDNLITKLETLSERLTGITSQHIKINIDLDGGNEKVINRMESYTENAANKMASAFQSIFEIDPKKMGDIEKAVGRMANNIRIQTQGRQAGDVLSFNPADFSEVSKAIREVAYTSNQADDSVKDFVASLRTTGKLRVSSEVIEELGDNFKNLNGLLKSKLTVDPNAISFDAVMSGMGGWQEQYPELFSDVDDIVQQIYRINDVLPDSTNVFGTWQQSIEVSMKDVVDTVTYYAQEMAKGMVSVQKTLKETGGYSDVTTDLSAIADWTKNIKKLSEIDPGQLNAVSDSTKNLAESIKILDGVQANTMPVLQLAEALERISKFKSTSADSLRKIAKNVREFGTAINESEENAKPKTLEDTLSKLEERYKDLGKGIQFTGSSQKMQSELDKYSNALEKAKIKKQELELSGKWDSSAYEDAIKDIAKYGNMIDAIKVKMSEMANTPIGTKKTATELVEEFKTRYEEFAPHINTDATEKELTKLSDFYRNQMEKAQNEINRILATTTADKQVSSIERAVLKLKEAENALKIIKDLSEKANVEDFNPAIHTADMVDAWGEKIEDYIKYIESIENKINAGESSSISYNAVIDAANDVADKFPEAIDLVERFENALEHLRSSDDIEFETPDVTKFNEEIAKLEENVNAFDEILKNVRPLPFKGNAFELEKYVDDLYDKLYELERKGMQFEAFGVKDDTQKMKNLKYQIEEIIKSIEKYEDELKKARSAGELEFKVTPLSAMRDETVKSGKELDNIINKYKKMSLIVPTTGLKNLANDLKKIEKQYDDTIKSIQQKMATTKYYGATTEFKNQQAKLEGLRNEYQKLLDIQREMSITDQFTINRKAVDKLSSSFSKAWSSFKPLKTAGNAITKMFRKLTAQGKKANNAFTRLYSTFKMMLRFSVLFQGMQAVTSGFTYGIKNLVQYSDKLNQSISLLWNSIRQLGNTLATMVDPLINALAPALDMIIQKFISAINVVNQFFNALTGNNTWIHAKKLTDDYAQSIKNANAQLRSFDELNNLTTTGQAGLTRPEDMFETLELANKWKELAKDIQDMWDNADFTGLGNKIGQQMIQGLKRISWNKIKSEAYKIGKRFTSLVSGALQTDGLGYEVGSSIAESLNTAFNFVDGLLDGSDFEALGKQIADVFNGLFDKIDWEKIKSVAKKGIDGIVKTVNSFTDELNWDNISKTIINGADIVSDGFITFSQKIKWKEIGQKLGEQLEKVVEDADWKKVGEGIGAGLQAALDFVTSIFKEISFTKFVDAVIDTIKGVFETADWKDFGKVVLTVMAYKLTLSTTTLVFKGAGLAIVEALKNAIIGSECMTKIAGGLTTLLKGASKSQTVLGEASTLGKTLGETMAGGLSLSQGAWNLGLIAMFKEGKTFFKQNKAIDEENKRLFSVNPGDYKTYDEYAKALQNISDEYDKLLGWKNTTSTEMSKLSTEFVNGKIVIHDYTEAIDKIASSQWNNSMANNVDNVTSKINEGNKALVTYSENWDDIANKSQKYTESFDKLGKNIADGVVEPIRNVNPEEPVKSFKDRLVEKFKSIFQIHSPSKEMYPIGNYITLGLFEGMKERIDAIENVTSLIKNTIAKSFNNISSTMSMYGNNVAVGFSNGIIKALNNVRIASQSLADTVKNKIKEALNIHSPSKVTYDLGAFTGEGFLDGFESMFGPIQKSLSNFAFDVSTGLSNITPSLTSDVTNYTTVPTVSNVSQNMNIDNSETNLLLRQLITAVENGSSIEIDGKEIFRTVKNEERKEYKSTGKHVFA